MVQALTIRVKLSLLIIVILGIITSVFSVIMVKTMNTHLLNELLKRAESLNRNTSALVGYDILSRDLLGIDNIVSNVKKTNPDVEYVAVIGRDGKIIVHTDLARRGEVFRNGEGSLVPDNDRSSIREIDRPSRSIFELQTPVVFKRKRIGTVVLGINKTALNNARADIRKKIVLVSVMVLVFGAFCIFFLSSFLTRPIKELSSGVMELKQGKTARPLRVYSMDELGKLTESFNEMSSLITEQRTSLGNYARELEEAYFSTVKVLAAAIDARDPYTLGHSTRVAQLSKKLGEKLGMTKQELEDLEIACLFHDVGKLKTPDYVLLKEGALDTAEYRQIVRHPEDGADILSRALSLHRYIPAVRHHHEWFNGSGYPDGLSGSDIPRAAAVIAVVDAFDAMTSTRPYKSARSHDDAVRELILYSGRQFDPFIVETFLQVLEGTYGSLLNLPGMNVAE